MLGKGLAAAVAMTVALGAGADAQAATFCVQKPKCVQNGGTASPTIASAFASAAGNGGNRDRVELGKDEFDDGPFTAAAGNPVNLVGSGVKDTTITRTSTTNNAVILTLADEGSSVSKLRVRLNNGTSLRGIDTAGAARGIRVVGNSASGSQIGVRLDPGASVANSRIGLPPATVGSAGIAVSGGPAVVRDTRLEAYAGMLGGAFSGRVRGIRLDITAQAIGFLLSGGNGVLDNARIRMLGAAGSSAVNVSPSSGDGKLTVRHLTGVGTGQPNTVGASSSSSGVVATCPTAMLILRNSILRGFETDLRRSAFGIMCTGTPQADIDVAWSNFDPASSIESGAGTIDEGMGNRNVNPRFANQVNGNYHLKSTSPLIDRGQPGEPKGSQSKTDLDGRNRVLDGDGNGTPRRDMGAYERPG